MAALTAQLEAWPEEKKLTLQALAKPPEEVTPPPTSTPTPTRTLTPTLVHPSTP